jgi:S-formylglutathione hydrolase FrmB
MRTFLRGLGRWPVAVAAAAVGVALIWLTVPMASGPTAATAAAPANPPVVWKKYLVQSPSSGKIERFWVGHAAGIPAGPAAVDARRYPVLYFLPGLLDGDDTWKNALDPVLGKFEIIAVCPAVGGAGWFMNSPRQAWMRWGDFLTQDLRAFIEAHYPASAEKGQRGLCGISAGGHGAFYTALTQPKGYGSVSVLSGAMDLRGYAGRFGLDFWIGPRDADSLPLYAQRSCVVLGGEHVGPLPFELFLDAGDTDGALPQMQTLRKVLEACGQEPKWFVGKGGHSWNYWNARAEDHLAWHNEQFAAHRRQGVMADKPDPKAPELKVLEALPDVALSEAATARLAAPWPAAGGKAVEVAGLPKNGGPLSKTDPKYKEVRLSSKLPVTGHAPGVYAFRVTLTVAVPMEKGGTLSLLGRLTNDGGTSLLTLPPVDFTVPAGDADRRTELRARLVIELKGPDPIRGGIVAALQPIDADGKPLGQPLPGKARPGSVEIETWPLGPTAHGEWVLTLAGDKALPLAALREFRLEAEP